MPMAQGWWQEESTGTVPELPPSTHGLRLWVMMGGGGGQLGAPGPCCQPGGVSPARVPKGYRDSGVPPGHCLQVLGLSWGGAQQGPPSPKPLSSTPAWSG